MNKITKVISILLAVMIVTLVVIPIKGFDFSTDTNFYKFTEGYRSYVAPIKKKNIVWGKDIKKQNGASIITAEINGVTLSEFRYLATSADATIEFLKHSDGTTYMICTGKHDATGHTLVVMIEPKNNLAYVYDTDSYASEVVNLGAYVQIYNGKTLVPLRKFLGIFGGEIKYYGKGNYDVYWPSLHK